MIQREYPLAGRELDREVAERLMGWTVREEEEQGLYTVRDGRGYAVDAPILAVRESDAWAELCPHYSTDIAAAWSVLRECYRRWPFSIHVHIMPSLTNGHWVACDIFRSPTGKQARGEVTSIDQVPEAICRAALMALDAAGAGEEG